MFRKLSQARRMLRMALNRKTADPELSKSTTKRKRFTGSYADLANLPSKGFQALQDGSSGQLLYMMDYDPIP